MPQYYFHLRSPSEVLLDPDGIELPDLDAARDQALRSARDTISNDVKDGTLDLRYRIDVEDEDGLLLHSLPLRQSFTLLGEV